jgi:hypothetical protein
MIAVVTTSQNREKKSVAKSIFSNKSCYFSLIFFLLAENSPHFDIVLILG